MVLAALTACGATKEPAEQPSPKPASRYPYTPADVEFMSGMIGHHAQAIVDGRLGADAWREPVGQTLCRAHHQRASRTRSRTMQQWLRDRNQPVPEADRPAMA